MKLLKKLCAYALTTALVAGTFGLSSYNSVTEVAATETSKIPFSGTLHIVGDSIADGYDNKNITDTDVVGWGNIIHKLFNESIVINNQANCGDSTNSFYYDYDNDGDPDNKRYTAVYDNLKENDYVIISFGHNDWGRDVSKRGTVLGSSSTQGTFQWWLKEKFIDPVLDAGAVPILMNSVAYCRFENGVYTEYEKHLQYGQAVRDLVAEYKAAGIDIIFIDALAYTGNAYSNMTESEAKTYHATNDNCHYNEKGAMWISEFICAQMESNNMAISDYLLNPTVTETPVTSATPTPTEAPEVTETPTATPVPEAPLKGELIAELDVKDETYKAFFSIDGDLQVGDKVFGDREVTFASIDESLIGSEYILTACDSKKTATDIAVVTAAKDIILSVGFDARLENAPSWVSDFTKTDKTCVGNNDVIFEIYQKELKVGDNITLGSQGQSSGVQGYIAMATVNTGSTEPVPTETTSPEPTETASPEPTETASPEPTETASPEPTETASPKPTETPSGDIVDEEYLYGDVNVSGIVDAEDALMILKHAAKLETITNELSLSLADANHDDSINASDALDVLKAAAKLISSDVYVELSVNDKYVIDQIFDQGAYLWKYEVNTESGVSIDEELKDLPENAAPGTMAERVYTITANEIGVYEFKLELVHAGDADAQPLNAIVYILNII